MNVEILKLVEHIKACADLWDKTGVSRVHAITQAANDIATLAITAALPDAQAK